jgi:hypothetical protein
MSFQNQKFYKQEVLTTIETPLPSISFDTSGDFYAQGVGVAETLIFFKNSSLFNLLSNLESLKQSPNISQFLYRISILKNISLTNQQERHFELKAYCSMGQHYRIVFCLNCHKYHYVKTSCGSFFCPDCRKYETNKIRRRAKDYLWNCNYFYATFTLPPEIQLKVRNWQETGPIYKIVKSSLMEYAKIHNFEIGFNLLPHSYGSLELNWFFHLNALISSKAFERKRINKDKKYRNFRYIFGDDYATSGKNIIDIQFDFKELRKIYKKNLEAFYNVKIKSEPQIKFAEDKKTKSVYVPYRRAINKLLNYFRHIPISMENIKGVKNDTVYYQSSKAKEQKKVYSKSLKDFFYLVMQHIPPHNFRTMRNYGIFANNHKKRKKYPTSPAPPKKSMLCENCKTPLTKENVFFQIHNNRLVWVNPNIPASILDYKGFDFLKSIKIDKNGRVLSYCDVPDIFKPPDLPKFPKNDTDDCSGESE